MNKYEYNIGNMSLTMSQMADIDRYYRSALIAQYVEENYKLSQSESMSIGEAAFDLMEKFGLGREDAIDEAMEELEIDL